MPVKLMAADWAFYANACRTTRKTRPLRHGFIREGRARPDVPRALDIGKQDNQREDSGRAHQRIDGKQSLQSATRPALRGWEGTPSHGYVKSVVAGKGPLSESA